MSTAQATLLPHHRDHLARDSGLRPEVIRERGYRSLPPWELTRYGFPSDQAFKIAAEGGASGILIPQYGPDGSNDRYVYRPDKPRLNDRGKPIKYEYPAGQGQRVDCPPRCWPKLADPNVPLWVTESNGKKSDSLAQAGFCAVGLNGGYGYKGRNQFGGVAWLADWDYIPTRGRKVIIAFDSDVTSNSDVRRARAILTEHFRRKGAKVKWVTLPHKPNGDKMGVDDYLLTHSPTDLLDLVQDAPADVAEEAHDERDKAISELKKALEREKRIVRGLRALLANPTLKAERATLATIGFEYYAKTSASGTPVRIYRAAIAEGAGNTPQTVSTHVKRGAELGVIEKFPTYDKDTMTSAMHIVCREPDLPEYLETLAGARPETKDGGVTGTWGGDRRCPNCQALHPRILVKTEVTHFCMECGTEIYNKTRKTVREPAQPPTDGGMTPECQLDTPPLALEAFEDDAGDDPPLQKNDPTITIQGNDFPRPVGADEPDPLAVFGPPDEPESSDPNDPDLGWWREQSEPDSPHPVSAPDPEPERHPTGSSADRRARLLTAGQEQGYPRLAYDHGLAIAGGEDAWIKFTHLQPDGHIDRALAELDKFALGGGQ